MCWTFVPVVRNVAVLEVYGIYEAALLLKWIDVYSECVPDITMEALLIFCGRENSFETTYPRLNYADESDTLSNVAPTMFLHKLFFR